jgi:hypothetical protein
MKPDLTPLESDLSALPGTGRDSRIVARHFGLDGKGGANFQVIGDEVGLTRERVRQIVLQAGARKLCKGARIPALSQAIEIVASSLPARASEIEDRLRSAGITSGLFRLEGIVNAARLVGRRLPFSVVVLRHDVQMHERFAVGPEFEGFPAIQARAHQKVRQRGMASVSEFLNDNRQPEAAQRERNFLQAVLSADKDFRWLDDSAEWFWFSEARGNLALRRIRKMLSVANPLSMEDLRAGLARTSDMLPSDQVLAAFCRQAPGIIVEGDSIRPGFRINCGDVLNQTEQNIFRILSERGGCMTNSELICHAYSLGIKRPTFYQCVNHSPIVSRDRGHYKLIGSMRQAEIGRGTTALHS